VNLAAKAVTFMLPLSDMSGNGFRTASEGPASSDPGVFEGQQKKLQAYAQTLPGAPVQGEASSYSPWEKFCGKGQDPNARAVCYTGKQGRNAAGRPVVATALIEPTLEGRTVFRVTLPSPLQLREGARLIIDSDPPISGAFFTCFANGCMADFAATLELMTKLKSGQLLQFQATNLAGHTVTFPVPLADSSGNSFQKTLDGLPLAPKWPEQQQAPK
jgi:invasion protein IalB